MKTIRSGRVSREFSRILKEDKISLVKMIVDENYSLHHCKSRRHKMRVQQTA